MTQFRMSKLRQLRRGSLGEVGSKNGIYAGEPQIWEVDYIQKN